MTRSSASSATVRLTVRLWLFFFSPSPLLSILSTLLTHLRTHKHTEDRQGSHRDRQSEKPQAPSNETCARITPSFPSNGSSAQPSCPLFFLSHPSHQNSSRTHARSWLYSSSCLPPPPVG